MELKDTLERRAKLVRRLEQCLHVYDEEAESVVDFSIENSADFAAVAGRALAAADAAVSGDLSGDDETFRINLIEAERYANHVIAVAGGE